MSLESFLEKKPLFYNEIDIQRFPKIFERYKSLFQLPKIVHIVGTNAKGSTGRALAHMLFKLGLSVGHYSSPHIMKFNERVWLNGRDSTDEELEKTHNFLVENILSDDLNLLSYFEYTTLLAMKLFCEKCEIVVLEAGLGGEFDATNVFPKILSIITPIGYDHQSFLGSNIKSIALSKLNSVTNHLVIAKQKEDIVYKLAFERIKKIKKNLYFADSFLDENSYDELKKYIVENRFPSFFYDNFSTAISALKVLGFNEDVKFLDGLNLFGRCQKISPKVTIDVGHNPLAAQVIRDCFRDKKVVLVYNSLDDKDFVSVLKILKPILKRVEILRIDSRRALKLSKLEAALEELEIEYEFFSKIDKREEYLVFGSFITIETFLLDYYEK